MVQFSLRIMIFVCLCWCWNASLVAKSARPNIVFIFADDQTFASIHELGFEETQTPNLDRIAKQGTTFTHAFNMGSWSGAVCIASRTMLNSGRFVWDAERIYKTSEQERKAGRWWSEYLKQAGYRTYMTGKWHCTADVTKAFDVTADVRGGMPKDTAAGYDRPLGPGQDPWSPSDPKFSGFWEGGEHWSEVVADHAEEFIRDASGRPEPFFMYLAFNAPHDPRQSPAEYVARYPLESIKLPSSFLPEYPYAKQIGCGPDLRDERLAPFPRTEYAVKVHRQEYYSIITHMDAMIGRILDALERSGKQDQTYIVFTADHGLSVGHHGLLGKQNLYDPSLRVPLMIVGPNVSANQRIDEPVYLQDVMPTTLQWAGIEKPSHVQFHSLVPLIDGAKSPYKSIYGGYLKKQRCIRTDRYKLIVYPDAKVVRLYDLESDPDEMQDLAQHPENRPLIHELFDSLASLQTELHDTVDLSHLRP